ncbi:MAG TPA: response regulator transcription factor [Actinomycetota bacterium]|nr:response regulator transcription factor [Actinomycetota bacterium]
MTIRLLAVADHGLVAEALTASLQAAHDIEIVGVAVSAREAAAIAQAEAPDSVVIGYELSGGDCATLTRVILEVSPESRVIIVTSFEDYTMLAEAMVAGCVGFVATNGSVEDLVEAVRAAHAGEMIISPQLLARLLPRAPGWRGGLGSDLSPREREVLPLMAEGLSNTELGERLFISVNTVRNHVRNILKKLGVHSRLEAVAIAIRNELISPSTAAETPDVLLDVDASADGAVRDHAETQSESGDGEPGIAVLDLSQYGFRPR